MKTLPKAKRLREKIYVACQKTPRVRRQKRCLACHRSFWGTRDEHHCATCRAVLPSTVTGYGREVKIHGLESTATPEVMFSDGGPIGRES